MNLLVMLVEYMYILCSFVINYIFFKHDNKWIDFINNNYKYTLANDKINFFH